MSSPMLVIKGVTIHFPHEPYDVQKIYMEKMIECLQSGVNGILESPTGTGKTLSLLCSSLAWLEDRKAYLQLNAGMHKSADTSSSGLLSHLEHLFGPCDGVVPSSLSPKIIYSSRTHSQLSQAINELKKTSYKYVRSVVLGSRDQLCIHPEVQRLQDNASKLRLCRHKVTTRSCQFHLNYDTKMTRSEFQEQSVMDIEDLGKLGKKFACCPYYAARTLKEKADIIFLPYNYLVDPKSRKAHGVDLAGNVVIFDEAHNIENMCEESMSFQLLSSDVALCIKEVSHVADLKQQKETESAFGSEGAEPDFTLLDIAKVKAILFSIEGTMDTAVAQASGESVTKPGNFMFEVLNMAGVDRVNKDELLDLLDKMVSFLEVNAVGAFSPKGTGLNRLSTILNSLYAVEGDGSSVESIFKQKYKVHIQKDINKKKGSQDVWTVSRATNKKPDWTLNCWCFSPSVSMTNLLKQGIRSIILTSGTLSPLGSFASELGIPFPVQLENPHVISDKQIYVSVLSNGCDGQLLNCTYENRSNTSYLASLGRSISNFCRVIPGGVLLFFPSYAVMKSFVEFWTSNGIMASLALVKPVVMEMQRSVDFSTLIQEYYENVDSAEKKGCILMAVCRGRMSEGMDFADQYARAAIIVGFPLPPCFDPRVQLKKQYLDESASKSTFSGNDWYLLQATRAVNQAIGRVIRHQDDFGAVLFCDKRYSEKRNLSQLSKWIRERTRVQSNFGTVLRELSNFFRGPGTSNRSHTAALRSGSLSSTKNEGLPSNAFGISSSSHSKPSERYDSFKSPAVDEVASDVLLSYMPQVDNETRSIRSVGETRLSIFDALNTTPVSKAVDFSSYSKINFRSDADTDSEFSQKTKRRKYLVPLKGIEPTTGACSSRESAASCSSAVSSNAASNSTAPTSKDIWKNILGSMKKSLGDHDYNSVCMSMKTFVRTQDSDALAQSLAHSLLNARDRESLLAQLARVVSSSTRKDFVLKCRSHW
ncbi:regulator of telomere elongation helicase 1 homolog [Ixodes scapularis]|uniref:regulator of telomere elongation helicase 1 homolog n=1 Tax=Ixodes scapularis TaxID=6945 RepID=UPI001C38A151|nr:regulator of telomere elongation helicase 1 homolog [Ixodes scapularis]